MISRRFVRDLLKKTYTENFRIYRGSVINLKGGSYEYYANEKLGA